MPDAPSMNDLLGSDTPKNWGKWGPDDEVGALNYLDAKEVLRGAQHIRTGDVFTLQIQMGRSDGPGDPLWPGRRAMEKKMELDESTWDGDGAPQFPGGLHYADDTAVLFLQGSTQYDALGHVWYDGQLWNGYDARSTVGTMDKASVLPIAEKGIVGRGVLIDMARHRGKDWLEKGETFDHTDLEAAASAQGVTIEPHDILCIRTGFLKYWYELNDKESFYDGFNEPGPHVLARARRVVPAARGPQPRHRHDRQRGHLRAGLRCGPAAALRADAQPRGHAHRDRLVRGAGRRLREDGRWTFLYAAAPLKVVGGSGAPVNPIAIR
jgi:hypothetical protein